MARDEQLYEIVSTDVWRALIGKLQRTRDQFAAHLVSTAAKSASTLPEIRFVAGHVSAVDLLLDDLQEIGKKGRKSNG